MHRTPADAHQSERMNARESQHQVVKNNVVRLSGLALRV
jgi:hypothetical protein